MKLVNEMKLICPRSNNKQVLEKDLSQGIMGVESTWCY